MTIKRIPSADSPGDFVGRGGLGAGGGRTYTGSTGGKSIVTGKKSSVSDKSKEKLKGKKKDKKQKTLTTEDGYKFYKQKDGSWTDTRSGKDYDMRLTKQDLKGKNFPSYKID